MKHFYFLKKFSIFLAVFGFFVFNALVSLPSVAEAQYISGANSFVTCTGGPPASPTQITFTWPAYGGYTRFILERNSTGLGTVNNIYSFVDNFAFSYGASYTHTASYTNNLNQWGGEYSDHTVVATCNANISVTPSGAPTNGTWNISSGSENRVGLSNTVRPPSSGAWYTITVTPPNGYNVSSITSSAGGSTSTNSLSMMVYPGDSANFSITYSLPAPVNNSPLVSAGVDRNITLPTSSIAASGASASDPDGDSLTLFWTNTSTPGPTPTISGGNTLTPTFGNMTTSGVYTFRLTADDGKVLTPPSDSMNVVVAPAGPPPTSPDLTASAPSPALATVGNPVTFTSSISNIGTGSTGAGFNNLFEVATAAGGGGTRSTVSVNASATLASGASANVNSSPYTFPSAGTFSVRTCADSSASIVESNEGNNCSGWTNVTVSLGSGGPYTVTATAGANGTISPSSQSVNSGNTTSFTVNPNSGYSASVSSTCGTGSLSGTTYTTAPINSNCSVTASFSAIVSMTGSVTANNCTIAIGGSSCNTSVIWSTTNPVTTSQVTSNKNNSGASSPGFVIGNGNSGGPVTAAIFGGTPSGTRGFFLYNSGSLLDSVNPSANCTFGSTWNGTICAANAPDLTAPAPTTNSATIGTPVSFSSSVSNIGTANTGVGFNNLWQVNTGANGGGTSSTVSVNAMAALPPASSYTATSSPYTFTSGGIYSVRICADMNGSMVGTITESDEGNNCSAWTNVTVPPVPDLTAAAPTPTVATAGTSLTFTSNISNTGSGGTGVGFNNFFQVASAPSGGGTLSSVSVNTLPALAGGSNANATSSPYTFSSAGTFSVRACADNNASFVGVISESNESNNCSGWADVVVAPSGGSGADLTAGSASPTTATGSVGQTYTASISNIGTTSTGTSFSYFWQRASAAAGGGTIISLASSSMSTLASGSSSPATSPSISFGVGTRSVRVCADFTGPGVGDVITETNEANNCGPWTDITVNAVTPSPTVDLQANPLAVATAGMTSSLTWPTTNLADPDYCTSNFFSGNRLISNNSPVIVTPVAPSSTYTIQCFRISDSVASAPDSVTVTVGAGTKKPIFIER